VFIRFASTAKQNKAGKNKEANDLLYKMAGSAVADIRRIMMGM
jgi:hypothetical protein